MSALLLASASSDASSPGSHASSQPPTSSICSRPRGVSDTAAFALKSFLLDEEIRIQQQRLQHMLQLRQQQLEEQTYVQSSQEIQYKHLVVQQRLLDLAGKQGSNGQTVASQVFLLPPPATGSPPAVLDAAPADNDSSLYVKRDPPRHPLQHTGGQLPLSPLRLADISEKDNCALVTAKEPFSVADKGSLPRQKCSQLTVQQQQSPSRRSSLPPAALRQMYNEHALLQQNSGQQSSAQQQYFEQPPEAHAAPNDRLPQQRTLGQQPVHHRLPQQRGHQKRVPSEWRVAGALKKYAENVFLTGRDDKGESNALASLESPTVVSYGAVHDVAPQASHTNSPPSPDRQIYQGSQQVQCEMTANHPTDASLGQGSSLTSWKPVSVRESPNQADNCQGPTRLQATGQREEERFVSTLSQDCSANRLKNPSAKSCPAEGSNLSSIVIVAKRASVTCKESLSPCISQMDLAINQMNTSMEHCSSGAAVEDIVPSGECMRAAPQCADDALTTAEKTVCDTQGSHIGYAGQDRKDSVKQQGSAHVPDPPTTAAPGLAAGWCAISEGKDDNAQAGQTQSSTVGSAGDTTEEKCFLQKDESFARLDLSLAVSQQLRSSHFPRGTDSALTQEMEEVLHRTMIEDDEKKHLSQKQKDACGTTEWETHDLNNAERGGEEYRQSEDARTPDGLPNGRRAVKVSSGITHTRGCGEGKLSSEGSNAAQVRRLAEKLLEQETEKRLMQEESFQMEQMLKRQYFQDIQQKEAEKEELQHQLTHTQEVGKSLQQRLSDVVQQKNQLYRIVLLAQDALAEAVASTPLSSRGHKFSGARHGSLIAGDKSSPRREVPRAATTGAAAAPELHCASYTPGQQRAESVNDDAYLCKAGERQLSVEEREEEETLEKLLASREEVSQALATLMHELKHAIEVLGTYGPSKEEEAKLSASLEQAVAACSDGKEAAVVSNFRQDPTSSVAGQNTRDLYSNGGNTDAQQAKERTDSDEEKDSKTGRQLRQLQEEVNVLRKNLKAFTEAVLTAQKQHLAAVDEKQRSRRATIQVPPRRKNQKECTATLGSGGLLPPQELTLQRLEELQTLNAKLLLDNTTLHRLYTQQATGSPEEFASKSVYRKSMGHVPSYAPAAAARQAEASGLQRSVELPLSQDWCSLPKDALQTSTPCLEVRPEAAAAPRTIAGAAASFSPACASPASPPDFVAPQRVPYCVGEGSPVASYSPASAFARADGRHRVQRRGRDADTANVIAIKNASGAPVADGGYPVAHMEPSSCIEGGQAVATLHSRETGRSGAPRSLSPPQQSSLRRELWHTPSLAVSSLGFTYTQPLKESRYRSVQICERPESGQLMEERSTPDTAQTWRREHMPLEGSDVQHVYVQQISPQPPSPVSQQPLRSRKIRESQPPSGAVGVVDTVKAWPPRSGVAQSYNNALGSRANSTPRLDGQRVSLERARQPDAASAAYAGTLNATQRAFPRLPQYTRPARLQRSQQETAFRPVLTPSSSLLRLPLLQNCTSGSSAPQAQRQQRVRALSFAGSRIGRRLPVTHSVSLLQQPNAAGQSQRALHSRSHSQFLTLEDSPGTEASGYLPALNNKGTSLSRSESVSRIDLTVWGQGVKHRGRLRYSSAANSAAPAGRAVGSGAGGLRHGTDAITAKVFQRTRRASAAVSVDHFPALTPAYSESRLLAAADEKPKGQQRGGCAFGRCWLGLSAASDKARDANIRTIHASHPWALTSPPTRHLQPSPSTTQDTAHHQEASPLPNFARWTGDNIHSIGSGSSARDSTPILQAHRSRALPLTPSEKTVAHNTSHLNDASPVVLPLHNTGTHYGNYHALASGTPPVILPHISQVARSQGLSPPRSPFFTTPPMHPNGGVHIPTISLPPAVNMSAALNNSQLSYTSAKISSCHPKYVAPPMPLTADWLNEAPKIPEKIPAAQELWHTNGAAH